MMNVRASRVLGLAPAALAAIIGSVYLLAAINPVGPPDTDAFWNAALRLRHGEALYPPTDPNADEVYRYAPWFAWLWVPLSFLPRGTVYVAWTALLAVCGVITVLPVLRRGWAGMTLGLLVLGVLLYTAAYGNPTPLISAGLVLLNVHPVALGIAASLKVYPLSC